MNSVKDRLTNILSSIPDTCTLVAVSKTKPNELIMEAYEAGQRHFGENKVQELAGKSEVLPKDIHWHMIGHLQRNKVKYIAPFVHLIHGVDSVRLLKEISKQAVKCNRTIDCLLQVHIADEETKFGFDPDEIKSLVNDFQEAELPNIQIVGLMGMATNTSDNDKVSGEFSKLKTLFDWVGTNEKAQIKASALSMGMSGDYQIAIENGSNMVRVGSSIFGARN